MARSRAGSLTCRDGRTAGSGSRAAGVVAHAAFLALAQAGLQGGKKAGEKRENGVHVQISNRMSKACGAHYHGLEDMLYIEYVLCICHTAASQACQRRVLTLGQ
jgi:hypothetical protein